MLFKENCYLSISQEADTPFVSLRLIQDKILLMMGMIQNLYPVTQSFSFFCKLLSLKDLYLCDDNTFYASNHF